MERIGERFGRTKFWTSVVFFIVSRGNDKPDGLNVMPVGSLDLCTNMIYVSVLLPESNEQGNSELQE
jgi:hypothetical protein